MAGVRGHDQAAAPACGWLQRVRDGLIDPGVRGVDPDSPGFAEANRRLLRQKPMLRHLFERLYGECRAAAERFLGRCPGRRVEIGSGSSFVGEVYPDLLERAALGAARKRSAL